MRIVRVLVVPVVVVLVLAYGGTVAYLAHFDRSLAPTLPADSITRRDPVALAAFNAIDDARCDYCHASGTRLPFYAGLPVAKQLMQLDLAQGPRHFNIEPVLKALRDGKPPSVEQLSRIEMVVQQGRMPPGLYLSMHWHARLSVEERRDLLAWIAQTRRTFYATPGVAAQFATEPVQPIPESVPVDQAKAALGRRLFFDTRLSGDGTLSCASCHKLESGGIDNMVTATGIRGQKGPINTPTVYNSVFSLAQFWNGRAQSLAEQAAGPVMNPIEMGSSDWNVVAANLRAEPGYADAFRTAFGSDTIDQRTVTEAIGQYERTLITPNGRFDRYLKGASDAIDDQEKRGYALFKQVGCASCHSGVSAGGDAFEIMGLEGPYFTDRQTPLTDADAGRRAFTNDPADNQRFKVPNLRNVALTAPYFHDGSMKTLEEAVANMARYQTAHGPLESQEVDDIVAFLETLTGELNGVPLDQVSTAPPLAP